MDAMENAPNMMPSAPPTTPAKAGMSMVVGSALFIAGLAVGAAIVWYLVPREAAPEMTESPSPSQDAMEGDDTRTRSELEELFGLADKEPGTELYYNERLGIGFTYLVDPQFVAGVDRVVTEEGNRIILLGQSIEVFHKDERQSLQEAIREQFLTGYSPVKCFTEPVEYLERVEGYAYAQISYPDDPVDGEPAFAHHECPPNYSRTNGVQYFMMNEAVPGTFVFVRIGQDSVASDGTPRAVGEGGFNWAHSIRILE